MATLKDTLTEAGAQRDSLEGLLGGTAGRDCWEMQQESGTVEHNLQCTKNVDTCTEGCLTPHLCSYGDFDLAQRQDRTWNKTWNITTSQQLPVHI